MNPFNFPQCYYTPASYFFTPILQEQPRDQATIIQQQRKEIEILTLENADLKEQIAELQAYKEEVERREEELSLNQRASELASRQQTRRRRKTMENKFTCPYESCKRFYGSTLALNLHIKLKHNGGTKKQRQTYAKIILACQQREEEPPKFDCNFPPGFLQEQMRLRNGGKEAERS